MAEVRPAAAVGSSTNRVRVYNPINPRKKRPWTYEQAAAKKDQAERFVRDVLEDDERADEIGDMPVEEYAAERRKELAPNPRRRKSMKKKVSTEQQQTRGNSVSVALETTTRMAKEQANLSQRNRELEKENESLQDKLDKIRDIVECDDPDCIPEDHLEDIGDIVAKGDDDAGGD
jgi:hypothetical protein